MSNLLRLSPVLNYDIVKTKGKYLYTNEGNKILDLQSGIWCTNIGHQHDVMVNTIRSQIEELIHLNAAFSNSIVNDLIELLCGVLQIEDGKGVFLSSGSEAVELGIRLSEIISTDKKKKLIFANSYLSAFNFDRKDGWIEFDYLPCLNCNKVCDSDCNLIKGIRFEDIGVFILESINGRMSIKPPERLISYFLTNMDDNTVLMANEVTNGFGRTGKWFGFMHYEDFKPDVVSIGKALGNGYPISGIIISDSVGKRIEEEGLVYVQSHQNDPLGCKIAYNVVKYIEENELVERGNKISKVFISKLKKQDISYIKEIRSNGLLISIDISDSVSMKRLGEELFDGGFFVGCSGSIMHLAPPLTIEIEDLDRFIEKLIELDRDRGIN